MFKFIRNFQNVFQCSSSVLHSYQQCHWPLVLSVSFILVILVAVKWCLILVLICLILVQNLGVENTSWFCSLKTPVTNHILLFYNGILYLWLKSWYSCVFDVIQRKIGCPNCTICDLLKFSQDGNECTILNI